MTTYSIENIVVAKMQDVINQGLRCYQITALFLFLKKARVHLAKIKHKNGPELLTFSSTRNTKRLKSEFQALCTMISFGLLVKPRFPLFYKSEI